MSDAFVHVSSADDPRLAPYRAMRDASLARDGLFLVESELCVRTLVTRSRFPVRSILASEGRAARLADVIEGLPPGVPVYVAPQPVLDAVAGFSIHRGVVAAAERTPPEDARSLLASLRSLEGPCTVVGLVGVNNHDNVGGVFRAAAAFGAGAVLLDEATCDPLYRKAIRVSVGASLFVPFARERAASMLSTLRAAGFTVVALTPRVSAPVLSPGAMPVRVALLLGAEGPGLPEDALAGADACARIAMAPGFDSLNVATTAAIALHALSRLT